MYKYGLATARIFKKHPGILHVRWYALPPVFLLVGSIALAITGLLFPLAWIVLAVVLGAYAALILLTTIQVAFKSGRLASVWSIFLIPCQHIAYALGFLYGLA